jgi:uncharacterized membrane protein
MTELRGRLLSAPRWVVGLVSAVPFGVFMGVASGLRHGSWTDGLIEGAIAGVVYGAIMGVVMHRRYGRYREAMGGVPLRDVRRAAREARRGRVPQDPDGRRAAYRLLDTQLGELRRQRRWAPVFFLVMAAGSVFLAVTESRWWWCAVCVWLGFPAVYFVLPQRLEHRLELLRD